MKVLFALSIMLCFFVCCYFFKQNVTEEIHILHKGFKGVVMIIQDDKNGLSIVKENGKTVFRIPENGILKTKTPLLPGSKNIKYYYEDKGNEQEIRYCWDCKKIFPNNDTIYVFSGSLGTYYGQGNKGIDFVTYLVCTQKQTDSLSMILEKMKPSDIMQRQ